MGQKKRTAKTSKGVNGAKKHRLTPLQKVLMGKGLYQSWPRLGLADKASLKPTDRD